MADSEEFFFILMYFDHSTLLPPAHPTSDISIWDLRDGNNPRQKLTICSVMIYTLYSVQYTTCNVSSIMLTVFSVQCKLYTDRAVAHLPP